MTPFFPLFQVFFRSDRFPAYDREPQKNVGICLINRFQISSRENIMLMNSTTTSPRHVRGTTVLYTFISYLSLCIGSNTVVLCVCVFFPLFWTSSSLDVPAGVTQEEGHTGFLIHLLSAVRALIFLARRIQLFLSLVDREVEFCVLTV